MAKLEGQKIADSYEQLLHTDRDGGGNGTTLVDIKDGKNDNTFALQLATDKVQANGTFTVGVDDTGYDVKFFGDTATNGYMLWDASTDDLILGTSSKLGIGTATPSSFDSEANNLVVGDGSGDNGITIFTGSSAGNHGSIFFGDATGTPKQGQIRYEQNNEVMSFHTNATERMRIDLNGNVGIGTANPDGTTHIHTASSGSVDARTDADDLVVENSAHGGISILTPDDQFSNLMFGSPSDNRGAVLDYSHSTKVLNIGSDVASGQVVFKVASSTEAMRLDASGNTTLAGDLTVTGGDISSGATLGLDANGSGTGTIYLNGGVIVNENSHDVDFRIESNDNANALFVDAGNNRVGVLNSSPAVELDVYGSLNLRSSYNLTWGGTAGANTPIIYGVSDTTNSKLVFHSRGTTSGASLVLDANSRISLSNNDSNTGNTVFGYSAFNTSSDNASDNNTVFGHNAMGTGAVAGASNNVAVGQSSLLAITTGSQNVSIGSAAMQACTTSANNVGIGFLALDAITTQAGGNVAVGSQALTELTTGLRNLAIGYQSLYLADVCDDSIAIGYQALGGTDTGTNNKNIAIGNYALDANMTHNVQNIAIGTNALTNLAGSGAISNTFIGNTAGQSLTNADYNTGVGEGVMGEASGNAITGEGNSALGALAGYNLEGVAHSNTLIGYGAGNASNAITTGISNVCIGDGASTSSATADNQISIGTGAVGQADNSVTLGNASVDDVYMAQDGAAEVHCGTLAVGLGTGSTAGSGCLAEIGDPETGAGGSLFKIFSMNEDTATTFFTIAGSNLWAGIIEITWTATDDTNRSGYQLSRFGYDDTFTSLINSAQNSTITLSLSTNDMQVSLTGAGSTVYRMKIRIMGGRRA